MNRKLKARIVLQYGTQADFAQLIGEEETIVSRIVRGRRKLNPEKEGKWAKALGCRVEDIFTD